MARLEEITRGTQLTGVAADGLVTVVDVVWHGADVIELTYKTSRGTAANTLLFRDAESKLGIAAKASNWSFSADGALLRLVSEARRIRMAHLFDPHLAVHTSLIDPLPHQITAVYGEMLVRQPLRFLLAEIPLVIARLDKLSRDEDVQAKLAQTEWDLIVCDEAHKMSASFFSGEIKETKRYKLGKLLAGVTRHFLLMTATPHNGKEEDFQLFLALLDQDRFEGRFRDGVHTVDVSDLMRRMVKEQLLKFNGAPLFPERLAYTVDYPLSSDEAALYRQVTEYVREQFNLAEAQASAGRKGTVGFALTTLQRRLASSPEAISQSLKRRRERLEKRLREEELAKRGAHAALSDETLPELDVEDLQELDDATDVEIEKLENQITDQATTARTIEELKKEILILRNLEAFALQVKRSGKDKKWGSRDCCKTRLRCSTSTGIAAS